MHANTMEALSPQRQDDIGVGRTAHDPVIRFLDAAIPLRNASHGDVVRYDVQTIWRHAECIATLSDGRKAKLSDSWQFIGYTGKEPARRLLFRSKASHIEVRIDGGELLVATEAQHTGYALHRLAGSIRRGLAALFPRNAGSRISVLDRARLYTAVDGSQVSAAGSYN